MEEHGSGVVRLGMASRRVAPGEQADGIETKHHQFWPVCTLRMTSFNESRHRSESLLRLTPSAFLFGQGSGRRIRDKDGMVITRISKYLHTRQLCPTRPEWSETVYLSSLVSAPLRARWTIRFAPHWCAMRRKTSRRGGSKSIVAETLPAQSHAVTFHPGLLQLQPAGSCEVDSRGDHQTPGPGSLCAIKSSQLTLKLSQDCAR